MWALKKHTKLSINQDYHITPEAILIVPVTGQTDFSTEATCTKQSPWPAAVLVIKSSVSRSQVNSVITIPNNYVRIQTSEITS